MNNEHKNNTSAAELSPATDQWTLQEEKKLVYLYQLKYNVSQMAKELGRTPECICGRLTSVLGYDGWSTSDTTNENGRHVCIEADTSQQATETPSSELPPLARHNMRWSKTEENNLRDLYHKGLSAIEIARRMGRSPLSICGRLSMVLGEDWSTPDTEVDGRGYHIIKRR